MSRLPDEPQSPSKRRKLNRGATNRNARDATSTDSKKRRTSRPTPKENHRHGSNDEHQSRKRTTRTKGNARERNQSEDRKTNHRYSTRGQQQHSHLDRSTHPQQCHEERNHRHRDRATNREARPRSDHRHRDRDIDRKARPCSDRHEPDIHDEQNERVNTEAQLNGDNDDGATRIVCGSSEVCTGSADLLWWVLLDPDQDDDDTPSPGPGLGKGPRPQWAFAKTAPERLRAMQQHCRSGPTITIDPALVSRLNEPSEEKHDDSDDVSDEEESEASEASDASEASSSSQSSYTREQCAAQGALSRFKARAIKEEPSLTPSASQALAGELTTLIDKLMMRIQKLTEAQSSSRAKATVLRVAKDQVITELKEQLKRNCELRRRLGEVEKELEKAARYRDANRNAYANMTASLETVANAVDVIAMAAVHALRRANDAMEGSGAPSASTRSRVLKMEKTLSDIAGRAQRIAKVIDVSVALGMQPHPAQHAQRYPAIQSAALAMRDMARDTIDDDSSRKYY